MEWKDLLIKSCNRATKTIECVFYGMTYEDLSWQPRPHSNSIGWTIWHLARVLDKLVSPIIGVEQLWSQEWHVKFDRPMDNEDTGWNDTQEQMTAFQCPESDILTGYYRAVINRVNNYLQGLCAINLDHEVRGDSWSKFCPTASSRIVIAVDELIQHAGQVGYIRGLRQGMEWQAV